MPFSERDATRLKEGHATRSLTFLFYSRFPIPDYHWVLVGIADLINRRSIMIFIGNAHPTILTFLFYSRFPISDSRL
ncbi:hypothetical protein [Moorena producens]|uniref:hypothetical protein n=1 Tax=Moorena producens TaxID=1155739 RepID=UPI0011EA6999|nr:hypothetical protein [Moorena producens]